MSRWTPPSASAAEPASRSVPNGAGQLFTSCQGVPPGPRFLRAQPERYERVVNMVETMESYFGSCSNFRECEAVCPKGISIDFIARMNRDYLRGKLVG